MSGQVHIGYSDFPVLEYHRDEIDVHEGKDPVKNDHETDQAGACERVPVNKPFLRTEPLWPLSNQLPHLANEQSKFAKHHERMYPEIVASEYNLPTIFHAAATKRAQVEKTSCDRHCQLEDDEPGEGTPWNLPEHIHKGTEEYKYGNDSYQMVDAPVRAATTRRFFPTF